MPEPCVLKALAGCCHYKSISEEDNYAAENSLRAEDGNSDIRPKLLCFCLQSSATCRRNGEAHFGWLIGPDPTRPERMIGAGQPPPVHTIFFQWLPRGKIGARALPRLPRRSCTSGGAQPGCRAKCPSTPHSGWVGRTRPRNRGICCLDWRELNAAPYHLHTDVENKPRLKLPTRRRRRCDDLSQHLRSIRVRGDDRSRFCGSLFLFP